MRLPRRFKGGGLRSLGDVAPAAFAGCVIATIPSFADTKDADGESLHDGLAPHLLEDDGSFEEGNEKTRFESFLARGSLLARRFRDAWSSLQRECYDDDENVQGKGPLHAPVESAGFFDGRLYDKPQRAITGQREAVAVQRLEDDLRELPAKDPRRRGIF